MKATFPTLCTVMDEELYPKSLIKTGTALSAL